MSANANPTFLPDEDDEDLSTQSELAAAEGVIQVDDTMCRAKFVHDTQLSALPLYCLKSSRCRLAGHAVLRQDTSRGLPGFYKAAHQAFDLRLVNWMYLTYLKVTCKLFWCSQSTCVSSG